MYCGKCIDSIGTQVPFPVISEPENCVLPYEDVLKWNDFKFSNGRSLKQIHQTKALTTNSNLERLQKIFEGADPNREYTSAELRAMGLTTTSQAAAVKNGFILKLGGGRNTRYILQFLKEE